MKRILTIALAIVLVLTLAGCDLSIAKAEQVGESDRNTSMFVTIETTMSWKIVYHRDTKVMYAVSDYGEGRGVFTVLVNPDGTPMLWDGR